MSKQHEPTAEAIVIEQYAIENANLRMQNANLQLELRKLQPKNEEKE